MTQDRPVDRSYRASSPAEQEAAYNDWATSYEADLCAMGYRIPAMLTGVFTRFVPPQATPILDAGCGGGIQAEALAELGYGPITGIDLSEGMMDVARAKGLYADLKRQQLGAPLDLPTDHFAATLSAGTITPGHAPPESFDELVRVTRPGGRLVFSLRSDAKQLPAYPAALERLSQSRVWTHVHSTHAFASMPYGEPDIRHQIHVYEVI